MFEDKPQYHRGLQRFEDWSGRPVTLYHFVERTRGYLESAFAVQNLSTAEGIYLRKSVEQALEAFDDEFRKEAGGELLNIPKEAAYRWLLLLYGIDAVVIDRELRSAAKVSPEFKEWLRITRERSHLL